MIVDRLFARRARSRLRRRPGRSAGLWGDRRGVVAMMFALATIPTLLLIGLAVDFGFIAQARAQLDLAADTAALTAAKTAGSAFIANQANYLTTGEQAGAAWFSVQAGSIPDAALVGTPSVQVTSQNNVFTANVSYTAQVTTIFHRLFNVDFVTLSNTASAVISANAYVDVTFLLDNSSSMLLVANQGDINTLQTILANANAKYPLMLPPDEVQTNQEYAQPNGGKPCAFACHWAWQPVKQVNPFNPQQTVVPNPAGDYYAIARASGIQLRYDVVQAAIASAISEMKSLETIQNQFSAGIFQFNTTLAQVFPESNNETASPALDAALTAAQTQVQTPALPLFINGSRPHNTNFPLAMSQLYAIAQANPPGDGSTPDKPRKALIIISDGVQDWKPNPTAVGDPPYVPNYSLAASTGTAGAGAEGPVSAQDCAAIKGLGWDVYFLYTTYFTSNELLPGAHLTIEPYVNSTTGTPYDLIANLKGCASPGPNHFAQASSAAEIQTAMLQMLESAINQGARLTH